MNNTNISITISKENGMSYLNQQCLIDAQFFWYEWNQFDEYPINVHSIHGKQ